MDLLSPLLISVGSAGAKFLAKKWMGAAATSTGLIDGEVAGELAGAVIDCFKDKIKDVREQRKAARLFEEIGDKIADRLRPTFEQAITSGQVNVSDVTVELVKTLEARVSAEFFVQADLAPARLTSALRAARPVERGTFSAGELAFYDQALEEAVRYLVSTASTLPRFQESFATESLTRLSHIDADLDKVLETAERIERHVGGGKRDEAARFEADYRHAVTQNLDYLELFGADLSPEARRHSLNVAYVSLNLQRQGEESTNLSVEGLLSELSAKRGRLLIFGEAGGGKSTLFRWMAIRAAKGITKKEDYLGWLSASGLPPNLLVGSTTSGWVTEDAYEAETQGEFYLEESWRNRIPFLIRLRDCTNGVLPPPDQFPALVAKLIGQPPQGWVRDVLKAGRGLVLLDGVDELANLDRDKLYGEIEAIVKAFPECYFVVSTRPQAVEEGWLKRLGFRDAAINPMSAVDREQFVDKWHQAVREELQRFDQNADDLSLEAASLKKKLKENPTLARLGTNPLMAAMICALHRRSKEHVPPKEADLVERLCVMLLDERDRLSGLKPEAYVLAFRKLDYKQKKAVVQELAHHMLVNRGQSLLEREDALQKVAYRLALLQQPPDDAADVLRALIERSGMLRERTPSRLAASPKGEVGSGGQGATIDFLHNTFKEYLAGTRLAHEGADGLLAKHWDQADWVPAILFAAAAEQPKFATGLIRKLLPQETGDGSVSVKETSKGKKKPSAKELAEARRRQLLALRCRAVGWEIEPSLTQQLQQTESELFPPRTMSEAEALGEAGEAVLPFLDRLKFDPQRNGDQSAACIRALRLIGLPETEPLLLGYAVDEREGVIGELAQVINPLLIPAVQRMVQESWNYETQKRQQTIRKQIRDLSPLAGLSALTSLYLINTPVSDLSPLSGLSGLTSLNLLGTQVSDLSPLAGLKGLTFLDLRSTPVSNLSPLAGLTKLRYVWVSNQEKLTIPESLRGVVQ